MGLLGAKTTARCPRSGPPRLLWPSRLRGNPRSDCGLSPMRIWVAPVTVVLVSVGYSPGGTAVTTLIASPQPPGLEPSHGIRPLSERRLLEAAFTYVFRGAAAFSDGELEAAQNDVRRRMASAKSFGLTERDVIVALLGPLFSPASHCRCSSCSERCVVCRTASLSVSSTR